LNFLSITRKIIVAFAFVSQERKRNSGKTLTKQISLFFLYVGSVTDNKAIAKEEEMKAKDGERSAGVKRRGDSITHEARRIVRVVASPFNLCSGNENLEEKRRRAATGAVAQAATSALALAATTLKSLYKGRINIIATKILAHHDYDGGEVTTAFFCRMLNKDKIILLSVNLNARDEKAEIMTCCLALNFSSRLTIQKWSILLITLL